MTYENVRILGKREKTHWTYVSHNVNGKFRFSRKLEAAMLFTRDKASELMMDSDEGLVIFDLYDIHTTKLSSN